MTPDTTEAVARAMQFWTNDRHVQKAMAEMAIEAHNKELARLIPACSQGDGLESDIDWKLGYNAARRDCLGTKHG